MDWQRKHFEMARGMWLGGASGPMISTKLKETFSVDISAPSIVSKMKREKVVRTAPRAPRRRPEPGLKRTSSKRQAIVQRPLSVVAQSLPKIPAGGILLTDIVDWNGQCHYVIGPVLKATVATVCGRRHANLGAYCDEHIPGSERE